MAGLVLRMLPWVATGCAPTRPSAPAAKDLTVQVGGRRDSCYHKRAKPPLGQTWRRVAGPVLLFYDARIVRLHDDKLPRSCYPEDILRIQELLNDLNLTLVSVQDG